ncbi:MAG: DNA polymerase III subunit delta [Treponema sp.]|jgi:DNA polymerase-3 subunit delta|nr:DNA polymerase III subunit delta [Treponema sp.]
MSKGRTYLYLGPEIGEKQDAIAELKRQAGGQAGASAVEETSFYAGETGVTDITAVLRNGSLFADVRLFFIKNAEAITKKEEVELLASYIANPQDDTILVFISTETRLDSRLEKTVDPKNKRIFWELFEDRKAGWVSNFFRREGYRISPEGIEAVLELVENNTDALRRECSRLMLFLGKEKTAGAEDVEKWLSHTREESAFTLFSRVAEGNLTKSIEILHTLLGAKESPQSIIAGLTWCYRKLRDYLALTARGIPDEFEFKKIGLASAKARKDYAAARGRSVSADESLALVEEFDLLIREAGSAPEGTLMDLLIYKLIINGEGGREKWYYY